MLTEVTIRNAKPKEKPYKLFDERGLFLLINPTNGGRLWRLKYQHAGREKLISLGKYPDVSLKRAREKRDEARRLLADGVDPSAARKAEKLARSDTFETIAREWLATQKNLADGTLKRDQDRLEKFVFPYIGNEPVTVITAAQLLSVLKRIEARGTHETAHRTRSVCGRVLRFAVHTSRVERDVSADLKGALIAPNTQNFAAIVEPARIGELLRAIDGYKGQPVTECALKLAPLVFVRPGELRKAEWCEFTLDSEQPEWRIPAARMKMKELHIVPLSKQAIAVLRELQPLTGSGRFVFPSARSSTRPMSENAITAALRRMGYTGQDMTWHGFRALASTCLNEQGWHPDLIELQLAHAERNKVRAAYNRAQRLAERREMMQVWAEYLDGLRAGATVIPIRRTA